MATATGKRPTIARIWRGRVAAKRADEYEAYNYEAGVKPLIEKALGVQALREDREGETEFVTISYWENIEAMARFTGADPTAVHHLPRDPEFLIESSDLGDEGAVQLLNAALRRVIVDGAEVAHDSTSPGIQPLCRHTKRRHTGTAGR